jgi:hypothetical protein
MLQVYFFVFFFLAAPIKTSILPGTLIQYDDNHDIRTYFVP